jgi:deoxyribonuclease V
MIAALDVHYTDTAAHAAAIVFKEWQSEEPIASRTATEEPVAAYEPGKFYRRELSPLLRVITQIGFDVHTYVIDGYCHLSRDLTPGLGAYLHRSLTQPAVIVGVAKNRYRDSEHAVEVFRANSKRPLFVTAIGIEYNVAAQHIQSMAGQFRIPKMLKAADGLARTEIES